MATDEFCEVRVVDGISIIRFRSSHILEAVTIDRIASRLKELVDAAPGGRFVVDFDQVTYLSSSALGMLISLQRRVAQRKAQLKLAGIRDDVMEVFQITKLDTVFDIYKDVDSAVDAFRSNK
jgi:anti-sigma B factor antagonist